MNPRDSSTEHAFADRPHRTLAALSAPVMVSLVAEPLTGLVDTAFVARLGSAELAALGAATALLSGGLWVFNFLGVGTQTAVAHAFGGGHRDRIREIAGTALTLSLVLGAALAVLISPAVLRLAELMATTGAMQIHAVEYVELRLAGVPATLCMVAAFGVMRGLTDMRTPLAIAIAANVVNLVLDPMLIWGVGPIPAFGIAGAAWASNAGQWLGAAWAVVRLQRHLQPRARMDAAIVRSLATVGRDMVIRTASLTLFFLLATRAATRAGAEAGAAHQVIRQVFLLTAILLDGFATAAQSLVGFFCGRAQVGVARRAAWVATVWSAATGCLLGVSMLALSHPVQLAMVPPEARATFAAAWLVAAVFQPINAVSFATDGIHWGTGDFGYLRNAMVVACLAGIPALALVDPGGPSALTHVWWITGGWIAVRALLGSVRVWPGARGAPLGQGTG